MNRITPKKHKASFFYLARCSDGSLYSGSTIDIVKREQKHNAGDGAKYTRSRRPVKIIYSEKYTTLREARQREAQVKRWTRTKKEQLVR